VRIVAHYCVNHGEVVFRRVGEERFELIRRMASWLTRHTRGELQAPTMLFAVWDTATLRWSSWE
jgi:hypothetical protein